MLQLLVLDVNETRVHPTHQLLTDNNFAASLPGTCDTLRFAGHHKFRKLDRVQGASRMGPRTRGGVI